MPMVWILTGILASAAPPPLCKGNKNNYLDMPCKGWKSFKDIEKQKEIVANPQGGHSSKVYIPKYVSW